MAVFDMLVALLAMALLTFEVSATLVIMGRVKRPTTAQAMKVSLLMALALALLVDRGSASLVSVIIIGSVTFALNYAAIRMVYRERIKVANATRQTCELEDGRDDNE